AFCVRLIFFIDAQANETLLSHIGETAQVAGVVVNDPSRRATSLHINIKVSSVGVDKATGRLLAILPRTTELEFGDHVVVSGTVTRPESFETDTGRVFDYAGYLSAQGVSAMIGRATLESSREGGWSVQRSLFAIKHKFEKSLESLFPEPDSSLLEGILLGERRGLPKELNDAFIISGLIHVVVLSGYNISIVSESILRATSFLPKTLNYSLGGVLMILFALMSGGGATTVRALVMGLIAVLARYLKRPADALRALVVAAAGRALLNPSILLHDPSFILSVLATFGLITISPSVEKYLQFITERFGLRSIAASTIAVQIFVLPALLYLTGMLSFLALPVVPFAMLFGFLAGLIGLIHPALAFPFTVLSDLLLRWIIFIANTAHALPFSFATLPAFPVWVAVLCYVPLTWFAISLYRRNVSQSDSN
ncbi:MAG: competence protein ComEC, partial [Parcubacteria group bacterium Gr01-1014_56]